MKFAVIGHPVGHSLSPRMHAANFRALGLDWEYGARDVEPGGLAAALEEFREGGYRGINVTIPHKEAVAGLVDRLDPMAERIGAVNTVRFEEDGSMTGFNTDAAGFSMPLLAAGFEAAGARVAIAGAGGAARAVAFECARLGFAEIVVANRTVGRAEELAAAVRAAGCGAEVRAAAIGEVKVGDWDLAVNATSLGLKESDPPAFGGAGFRAGQTYYDIIPLRRETPGMKAAREAGARVLGGLGFLAAQGAAAFEIWTGLKADLKAMEEEIWK